MQTYLFMGEFCTPLKTMREMTDGGIANFSDAERQVQMQKFCEKVLEILKHPTARECGKSFLPLLYDDKKESLAVLLCDAFEKEE